MEIILVAATAAFGFTSAASSLEGVPTAAARYCIGIINGKPGAHQAVDVVDFAAIDIAKAHLIDKDFEFALRNDGVTFLLFVKGHAVLEAGAATTGDEDSEGEAGVIFLR